MSDKHILKLSESEAVVKIYESNPTGALADISLANDLTKSTEVFVDGTSKITIKAIYWGAKANKQINIQRITNPVGPVLEGDYYLLNSGHYEYKGFVDNAYASKDIRVTGDGPFHCILVLGKSGWQQKVETAQFSIYDNVTQVGS